MRGGRSRQRSLGSRMVTRSMARSRMSTKVEDLEGSLGELSNMVQENDMGLIMEVEEEMVNVCMLKK